MNKISLFLLSLACQTSARRNQQSSEDQKLRVAADDNVNAVVNPVPKVGQVKQEAGAKVLEKSKGEVPVHVQNQVKAEEEKHAAKAQVEYEFLRFVIVIPMAGLVLSVFLSRYSLGIIQYSVIIFLFGVMTWMFASEVFVKSFFAQAVDAMLEVDPRIILAMFLPALLFANGMRTNRLYSTAVFWQVLFLAGPGVIISTSVMAGCSYLAIPYDWPWTFWVMVGALLAMTDPASVAQLFNQYDISPVLKEQINGESLINDSTGILLFNLVFQHYKHLDKKSAVGSTLIAAAKAVSVAPIVGIVLGIVTLLIFRVMIRKYSAVDKVAQVMLPVCCAYLAYLITEQFFQASGVLAVAGAAAILGAYLWSDTMQREVLDTMWLVLEFISQSAVFFIGGLYFASVAMRPEIQAMDYAYLAIGYVFAVSTRMVMLLLAWPVLNLIGPHVSFNDIVLLCWSGLRGSCAMMLVSQVDNYSLVSKVHGSQVVFFVCGVSFLTMVINGILMNPLLSIIGKRDDRERPVELASEKVLRTHFTEVFTVLRQSGIQFDPIAVLSMVGIDEEEPVHIDLSGFDMQTNECLSSAREVYLGIVRSFYKTFVDFHLLPTGDIEARLTSSVAEALISTDTPLSDWACLDVYTAPTMRIAFCRFLDLLMLDSGRFVTNVSGASVESAVYCTVVFIEAHQFAQREIMLRTEIKTAVKTVVAESRSQLAAAKRFLHAQKDWLTLVRTTQMTGLLTYAEGQFADSFAVKAMLSWHGQRIIEEEMQDAKDRLQEFRKNTRCKLVEEVAHLSLVDLLNREPEGDPPTDVSFMRLVKTVIQILERQKFGTDNIAAPDSSAGVGHDMSI